MQLRQRPARKPLYVHNSDNNLSIQTWSVYEQFDSKTFHYISRWQSSNKITQFKIFNQLFGLCFVQNPWGSCHFHMTFSWPAKRYSKTVQIEVKFYMNVAWPKTEHAELNKSDIQPWRYRYRYRRYRRFKKGIRHVNQFTFGSNGLSKKFILQIC